MSVSASEVPVTLIIISFMVGIGLIVTTNIFTILDGKNLGTAGNNTRSSLESNTWSGFDLTALLPIVLGAAGVITVLVWAFGKMGD